MSVLYGKVLNGHLATYTVDMGIEASAVFSKKSLRAVVKASTERHISLAADAATTIVGFIDFVGTASSTAGDTRAPVEHSCLVSYEAPVCQSTSYDVALTQEQIEEMVGTTCGVLVDSNILYADIANTTSAQQVLIITGGRAGAAGSASLFVKQNPLLSYPVEAVDAIA